MGYTNAWEKLRDNEIDFDPGMELIDENVFVESLIGVTTEMRAVYDYDKMVEEYAEKTGCDADEAIDYVDNIVRFLGYGGKESPVVLDSLRFT